MTSRSLLVEIWGDIVCPWCYVGKARFDRALAAFPHRDHVVVTHRSFELRPDYPKGETISVLEMLARAYGMSPAQAEAAERRVGQLAAVEGLPFDINRQYGNTLDAHRLLCLADEHDQRADLLTALYRAYFSGERSIFDPDSLAAIAVGAGLEAGRVRQALDGDAHTDAVRADQRGAAEHGVRAVPFVLAGGTHAVSGAQPVAAFADALTRAWDPARHGPVAVGSAAEAGRAGGPPVA